MKIIENLLCIILIALLIVAAATVTYIAVTEIYDDIRRRKK